MIYHHQFLIDGLVFPQTKIIMKPQVLHKVFMKLFYKTNRYRITISAVELENKIQKQLKNMLLKNLSPPIKLKQLSLLFMLNHINNSFYHVKNSLCDFIEI